MKMSGEEIIPAPREVVWKALNDPAVLKQCIPGCESITKHSDTKMEAKVVVKLGPVKARFTGAVDLTDLNPPKSYRISGQGNGGLAGAGMSLGAGYMMAQQIGQADLLHASERRPILHAQPALRPSGQTGSL